jgi:phospholipid/cholesterol/gamma-HCH transport system substrate-binding protein
MIMEQFYPHKRNYEAKVGIIAVIALLSLVLGYSWLKDYFALKDYSQIKISFSNANDLKPGDVVTVRGVEKGHVKSLEVGTDRVVVVALVKLNEPLKEGSHYSVREGDLMGKRQLEIMPGTGQDPIDLAQIQIGDESSGLMDLISNLNTTINTIDNLVSRFTKDKGLISNIESTVASSEKVVSNANEVILKNSENVTVVLQNLLKTSKELSNLLEHNKTSINKSLELAPEVLDKMNKNLSSLEKITENFVQISDKLNTGDGSVQHLMNDKEFYKTLLKTTQELDSLLIDVKANPTRYFKVKVF